MKTLTSILVTAISVASLSLVLSGCATKSDHMGYSAPVSKESSAKGYTGSAESITSSNTTRGSEQMENFRNTAEKKTNPDRGMQSNK